MTAEQYPDTSPATDTEGPAPPPRQRYERRTELDEDMKRALTKAQGSPRHRDTAHAILEAARIAQKRTEVAVNNLERPPGALPVPPRRRPVIINTKTVGAARGTNQKKFNPQRQAQYLDYLAANMRRGVAAKMVGVSPTTISQFRKSDPGFAEKEQAAEAEAGEAVEDALFALATEQKHFEAIKFILINRMPDKWRDPKTIKVEHSGTVTQEIEAGPALERIALLEARLTERKAITAGPGFEEGTVDAEWVDDPATPDENDPGGPGFDAQEDEETALAP